MDHQPVTSTVWKIEVGKIETRLTFKANFERLETGDKCSFWIFPYCIKMRDTAVEADSA